MTPVLVQKSDTAAPLDLTIEREGVGGVTGKAPTVAIRNSATVNSYLDFGDGTFKTAGWVTKYASMTEVERGHYQRALNVSTTSGITIGMILAAEFHVDDGAGIVGDDMDMLSIVEEIYDVATEGELATPATIADAVWDEAIAGHLAAGSTGEALNNASSASTETRVEQSWTIATTGGIKLRATIILQRNGVFLTAPGTARLDVTARDSAGTLLFQQTSLVPNAQGFWALEQSFTPSVGVVIAAFAAATSVPGSFTSVVGISIPEFP